MFYLFRLDANIFRDVDEIQAVSPVGVNQCDLYHAELLRQSVVELTAQKSIRRRPWDREPGNVSKVHVVVVCGLSTFPRCSELSPRGLLCIVQQLAHLCRMCCVRFALIEFIVAERRCRRCSLGLRVNRR